MRLFFLALIFSLPSMAQQSIYDLNVETGNKGQVSLHHFRGQKIVIAAVKVDLLGKKGAVEFWDSLKTAYPKIAFFLIAGSDKDSLTQDSAAVENVKNRPGRKVFVSEVRRLNKKYGKAQDAVMQWLTDVNKNERSDTEVDSDLQIYVISESGVLYSILQLQTPAKILKQVLEQPDFKPNVYGVLKP